MAVQDKNPAAEAAAKFNKLATAYAVRALPVMPESTSFVSAVCRLAFEGQSCHN